MDKLKRLAIEHNYYCSDVNYYNNEAGSSWETATDFLDEFEDADVGMNMVFRWDVTPIFEDEVDEENPTGEYKAEVFIMHQRKGAFAPHRIARIGEDEVDRFEAYLKKHWDYLRDLWAPVSGLNAALAIGDE